MWLTISIDNEIVVPKMNEPAERPRAPRTVGAAYRAARFRLAELPRGLPGERQ